MRMRSRSPQVPDQRTVPSTLSTQGPVAPPSSVAVAVMASSPSAVAVSVICTAQLPPGGAGAFDVTGGPVSSRPAGVRVTARTATVYGAAQGSPATGGSEVPVVVRVARVPVAEVQLTS